MKQSVVVPLSLIQFFSLPPPFLWEEECMTIWRLTLAPLRAHDQQVYSPLRRSQAPPPGRQRFFRLRWPGHLRRRTALHANAHALRITQS
ncbi:hypothetical protein D6833_06475 [Candidatus Parcubacteria bacterium]|nr:MAG: hypothetical protein D6833_06475 [Candidatus Parcubacteria bacterium]